MNVVHHSEVFGGVELVAGKVVFTVQFVEAAIDDFDAFFRDCIVRIGLHLTNGPNNVLKIDQNMTSRIKIYTNCARENMTLCRQ